MQIQKRINDIQQLQQLFPELIAITDGTEQQIQRPYQKKNPLLWQKEETYCKESNYD